MEDENGTPLDVGRKQRTICDGAAAALWAQDSHCSFPGCHNRCYVDAHHIEHWADGGDTSLQNLTLLCTNTTLLHEAASSSGEMPPASYFQRPDGLAFRLWLDDLRDDYIAPENPSMEVREPRATYRARAA